MATTDLAQGLERYRATRAELEAAIVVNLRGASSEVLLRVADFLLGAVKAVEGPPNGGVPGARPRPMLAPGPQGSLKVAEAGVTVVPSAVPSAVSGRMSPGAGVLGQALVVYEEMVWARSRGLMLGVPVEELRRDLLGLAESPLLGQPISRKGN